VCFNNTAAMIQLIAIVSINNTTESGMERERKTWRQRYQSANTISRQRMGINRLCRAERKGPHVGHILTSRHQRLQCLGIVYTLYSVFISVE